MDKKCSSCVICKKDTCDKVIIFNEERLQKCKGFSKIRQQNGLKFSDVILPANVTPTKGYHAQCYRNFSALMKQHVLPEPSTSSSGDLLASTDAQDQEIMPDKQAIPESEENVEIDQNTSEIAVSSNDTQQLENAEDLSTNNENVCLFCTKSAKKTKGQIQKLFILDKESLKQAVEPFLSFVSDTEIYQKLQESDEATILKAHRTCRKEYINSLQLFQDKPQTNYHKNLEYHKQGFEEICDFIDENVIAKEKCYFFTYLCDYYVSAIKNAASKDGHMYDNIVSKANFETKLKKHYDGQLKISILHNKKIIGPINRVIDDHLFSLLEEKAILHNAALILRRKILDIEKQTLPEDIKTSDLLRGECCIPQTLKAFYLTVLAGSHSRRRKSHESFRISNSLASDLIYNVSKGKIKTSKHITLGMTLKSLTSSRKVVEIINRYGHCCSYHVVEELETEATFTSAGRSELCPDGIIKSSGLNTGVAFDNFDRFVDTASGKDTLHDTVGIIYQDVVEHPTTVRNNRLDNNLEAMVTVDLQDDVGADLQNTVDDEDDVAAADLEAAVDLKADVTAKRHGIQRRKTSKRRRAFETFQPELQPFNKKAKISDLLMPVTDDRRLVVPKTLEQINKIDVLWMLSHALEIPNTPMWVGFNSKFIEDKNKKKQVIRYLTPINDSPTDSKVILETMKESQKIAEELGEQSISVSYDLAIAKVAMQIQSTESPNYDNVFIHLGTFHVMIAYFKAVGKFIAGCGLMNIAVDCGLLASGSVESFLTGKHFNRCKRIHPLMSLGLEIMNFQLFLENQSIMMGDILRTELLHFNEGSLSLTALLENQDMSELLTSYFAHREACLNGSFGKTPQMYITYIYLINYYHILSRSIRTGDFALFKYVLPKITNLFFAFNQPNYARWLVKYHNNLLKINETHPEIAESMEKGCLGIKRTDKPFSRQSIDLTLEQTINAEAAKRLVGIINFTNSISARQRWCKSHEIRSTIISFTYETTGLQKRQDVTSDLENHKIKRDTKLLKNFIATFSKFMNPFDSSLDKNLLFNISTGKSASENVDKFLLNVESTGNELREKFISECSESVDRFEKPITRVKIMNFTSETVKKRITGGNNVQEIRMQRDLFGRMLGISMDYKLDFEKILCYPIIPIPSSLCHFDGTICKTEKSAIVKVFEKNHKPGNTPKNYDIVIVDGFYLLHTMRDMPATIGNISKKIMQSLTATTAPRVDIIFDQYFSPSVKDYERALRNEINDMDYKITGPMQIRPVDFSKELKNIKFKQALVNFLIDHWATQEMVPFIGNTIVNLSYDKCFSYKVQDNVVTVTENYELSCDNHEEADTKIVHHVCRIDNDVPTNILIKSCDTDVLIIMLGNMDHLECDSLTIFMEYGNNKKKRLLNISQLSTELGPKVCSSLPGFHAMTGCDYNPSFFKKGKKRPFLILKTNEDYQKAFTDLGSAHVSGSRYEAFSVLEKFVCEMYGFKNVTDVNTARFHKFCSTYKANNPGEPFKKVLKNYDASNLPPCRVELHQQLLRTQYITSIWRNAHLRYPSTLTPKRNGWDLQNGKLEFYWFEGDCVPPSVLDALESDKAKTQKSTINRENTENNDNEDDSSDGEDDLSETEDDPPESSESSEEE